MPISIKPKLSQKAAREQKAKFAAELVQSRAALAAAIQQRDNECIGIERCVDAIEAALENQGKSKLPQPQMQFFYQSHTSSERLVNRVNAAFDYKDPVALQLTPHVVAMVRKNEADFFTFSRAFYEHRLKDLLHGLDKKTEDQIDPLVKQCWLFLGEMAEDLKKFYLDMKSVSAGEILHGCFISYQQNFLPAFSELRNKLEDLKQRAAESKASAAVRVRVPAPVVVIPMPVAVVAEVVKPVSVFTSVPLAPPPVAHQRPFSKSRENVPGAVLVKAGAETLIPEFEALSVSERRDPRYGGGR